MKHALVGLLLLVGCSGSSKDVEKPGGDKSVKAGDPDLAEIDTMLAESEALVQELCACKDDACRAEALKRGEEAGQRYGERIKVLEPKMSDAHKQRIAALGEQARKCGGGECPAQQEAQAFIAANEACKSAADCTSASAGCYNGEDDCCVVYVNKSYDQKKWEALLQSMNECNRRSGGSEQCACCAKPSGPPECVNGTCQ